MPVKTIQSMVDWIEKNIMENPTLIDLSNYVGYSSCYCSAKFHEKMGVTFKQYLAKRKISLAASEVRDTRLRLIDISIKYGYSSHESFTRAFVNTFGCTPRQYRKRTAGLDVPVKNICYKPKTVFQNGGNGCAE